MPCSSPAQLTLGPLLGSPKGFWGLFPWSEDFCGLFRNYNFKVSLISILMFVFGELSFFFPLTAQPGSEGRVFSFGFHSVTLENMSVSAVNYKREVCGPGLARVNRCV